MDHFDDQISSPISPSFPRPDATLIGRDLDLVHLSRLLQLILGCAVNCDRKEDYIAKIMSLEVDVQMAVKQAIEELLTSREHANSTLSIGAGESFDHMVNLRDSLKRTADELAQAVQAKERTEQSLYDLRRELDETVSERDQLRIELAAVVNRVRSLESTRTTETHEPSDASLKGKLITTITSPNENFDCDLISVDRHVNKLQLRIDQLQDDLFKLESAKGKRLSEVIY